MLSVYEALTLVLDAAKELGPEQVDLASAAGRVLYAPMLADLDDPPFDRSAMDGYALRAADVATCPAELRVIGEVAAGDPPPDRRVEPGEAMRIMTGAPIPDGADSVQMVEHTGSADDPGVVVIRQTVTKGAHIRWRAEVVAKGSVVLEAGRLITADAVGVLASFGAATVEVYRRPRVFVTATGDELVGVDEVPGPGQIRDSNRWTAAAVAREAGAEVTMGPTARDDREALLETIRAGLGHDVLVLSGGVSMGVHDIVGSCLRELGVEVLFHKVAIQPGKPLLVGKHGETLVFALPGNPVSVLVTARAFLAPALRRMAGSSRVTDPMIPARLKGTLREAGERTIFHPAVLTFTSEGPVVEPVTTKGSADQVNHARRNCFILRARGGGSFDDGATVACILEPGTLHDTGQALPSP